MKGRLLKTIFAASLSIGLLAGCAPKPEKAESTKPESKVVNVYSARNYEVDKQLYDMFTKETGIKVNVVQGKAEELIERLKREGANTEADLFVTVDGGVLDLAKKSGTLQPIKSTVIDQNVPTNLRDKDSQWIGLSTRARIIAYSKDRVKPEQLSTYEDLASPKWKGKVLARSSTSLYNQSLLASLISLEGEQKAEAWAKGVTTNFARNPEGGDRDQAKAIVSGNGDLAIMNTYYVGQLLNSKDPEEVKVGNSIGVFFPNQQTTGTHINISGAGLVKHSKNKENAIKLLEFLTSEKAQSELSKANFEFPVNKKAEVPELLKSWGEFKTQNIDFAVLGENNAKATQIFTKVGWK